MVVPVLGEEPESAGRAENAWVVEPATTAKHMINALTACLGRAVSRHPIQAAPVAVLNPLPNVPVHVIEAKGIWPENADG